MSKRLASLALALNFAMLAAPASAQNVEPREAPQALPNGSFFPPSQPMPPMMAPQGVAPVDYLPSETGPFGLAQDEFVPRLWMDPELVVWKLRKGQVKVPLITTGTTSSFGIVGRNGTVVQNSNEVDYDNFAGARLMGGVWYDDSHFWGMEGGFTWFGQQSEKLSVASNAAGSPVIARPFFDAATNSQSIRQISFPGRFAGSVDYDTTISLWGAEFSPLVIRLNQGDHHYLYGLLGFKYFNLTERLSVSDRVRTLAGGQQNFNGQGLGNGSVVGVTDSFDASNDLYGGIIGARFGYDRNRFFFDITGKLGLMHNHEVLVDSGGTSALFSPAIRRLTIANGGLLVGPFNARREAQAGFVIVPEVNAQFGYQLTNRMAILFGYNVMYISSVIRPEDQLARTVNAANAPWSPSFGATVNSKQPFPLFNKNEFLAQGLSIGLSLRY